MNAGERRNQQHLTRQLSSIKKTASPYIYGATGVLPEERVWDHSPLSIPPRLLLWRTFLELLNSGMAQWQNAFFSQLNVHSEHYWKEVKRQGLQAHSGALCTNLRIERRGMKSIVWKMINPTTQPWIFIGKTMLKQAPTATWCEDWRLIEKDPDILGKTNFLL